MITFTHKGDFKNTDRFLTNVKKNEYFRILNKWGKIGVAALSDATPIDTGLTASSWSYTVRSSKGMCFLSWHNSHIVDKVPIAIILQYGHATKAGTFVQGRDYINPAMQSLFDTIADGVWEEVKNI